MNIELVINFGEFVITDPNISIACWSCTGETQPGENFCFDCGKKALQRADTFPCKNCGSAQSTLRVARKLSDTLGVLECVYCTNCGETPIVQPDLVSAATEFVKVNTNLHYPWSTRSMVEKLAFAIYVLSAETP